MADIPVVHDRFNPPVVEGLVCGEGKTHQEFKDECDINFIMSRALRSGVFPPAVNVGRYGDFSEVGDYQEALETISRAKKQFAGLSSVVRERFDNDPGKFLAWLGSDKFNLDDAHEFGILSEEAQKRVADAKAAKAAASAAVTDKK